MALLRNFFASISLVKDVAVKHWREVILILPPTSCSLSQSFEPFFVHAKILQQKQVGWGEMNLISFYLMEDFLIFK